MSREGETTAFGGCVLAMRCTYEQYGHTCAAHAVTYLFYATHPARHPARDPVRLLECSSGDSCGGFCESFCESFFDSFAGRVIAALNAVTF